MKHSRTALVVGTAAVGLSVLAACGGSNSAATSSGSGSTGSGSTGQPTQSQPAANGQVKLATRQAGSLGTIIQDGSGRTLYVYDLDSKDKSNCYGGCAALWPPVKAGTGKPQLMGVPASEVGTTTRTDGTKQVTLAGSPLYLYAGDAKPGDTSGQSVQGTWWVVGPNGQKITTQASTSSQSSTGGGVANGY